MADPDFNETTAGGVLGRVVGKAKAAVGSLTGNRDLQREGNLQHAQAEAEQQAQRAEERAQLSTNGAAIAEQRAREDAERERLRTEIDAEDRKERIDAVETRRETDVAIDALQAHEAVEQHEALAERASEATERAAVHRRLADEAEIARLEFDAANAERVADTIDPEAK